MVLYCMSRLIHRKLRQEKEREKEQCIRIICHPPPVFVINERFPVWSTPCYEARIRPFAFERPNNSSPATDRRIRTTPRYHRWWTVILDCVFSNALRRLCRSLRRRRSECTKREEQTMFTIETFVDRLIVGISARIGFRSGLKEKNCMWHVSSI